MACRICYEDGELISVCGCTGSAGLVHEECIKKWILISKRKNCEICHEPYTIQFEIPIKLGPLVFISGGVIMSAVHAIFLNHHIHLYPSDCGSVLTFSIMTNSIISMLWCSLRWHDKIYQKIATVLWFFIFMALSLVLESNGRKFNMAAIDYSVTISTHIIFGFFSFSNIGDRR